MTTDVVRSILLGLLQGFTEFLPVSSSGHLVLIPALFDWPAAGLSFDAVVHGGTALALVAYFRADWWRLLSATWGLLRHREAKADDRRMLVLLGIGSTPAITLGLLLQDWFEELFEAPAVAAGMLLVTGSLLVLAERLGKKAKSLDQLSLVGGFLIGCAQAAAMVPGISRSGATISAGQLIGLNRHSATRFSFLLAAPVTAGAAALRLGELLSSSPAGDSTGDSYVALAVGFVAAFASGYWSIGWLLQYVRRAPLYAFAAYTWLLGVVALWLLR